MSVDAHAGKRQRAQGPNQSPADYEIDPDTDPKRLIASQKRELATVSNRLADAEEKLASIRYKLGSMIVEAFLHPGLKTLSLPVDLVKLWRTRPASTVTKDNKTRVLNRDLRTSGISLESTGDSGLLTEMPRDTILFVPINGTGLGHLTRCMAIASAILSIAPEKQIIFFTTSVAVPILFEQDFFAYHLPPRSPFEYLLSEQQWNEVFNIMLGEILRVHRPGTVVFDGTYPFDGLQRSMDAHSWINWIWVKRGLHRTDLLSETVPRVANLFDRVIVPAELDGNTLDETQGKTMRIGPIIYRPPNGQMTRQDARKALRLNEDQAVAYVQLGAGNINDIQELTQRVIDALNARIPELQLVIGESPITRSRFRPKGRCVLLRDFPNSSYFNAFDVAILAAGYNSVYETVFFQLPTIFLPRMVGTDDQLRRAQLAQEFGNARVMEEFEASSLCNLVAEMLERRDADRGRKRSFPEGAQSAADLIVTMANAMDIDSGSRRRR